MASLTLYYFPPSYYSQKALLILHEKEVKFNRKLINIHSSHGDQNEPWYMRMNSRGVVPVLKHGDKIVCESEDIMDYIDSHFQSGSSLIPAASSEAGKEVAKIRQLISSIKIEIMTYGVMKCQELSVTGIKLPKIIKATKSMTKEAINKEFSKKLPYLESMSEKHPDLKEAYQMKIKKLKEFSIANEDREAVNSAFDHCEKVLAQIEEILKKAQERYGIPDCWLAGPRFTAADVSFAVLLMRLDLLGVEEKFYPKEKRPYIYNYYQRLMKRKAVQLLKSEMKSLPGLMIWSMIKDATPYISAVAVVGVALGVAFAVLKHS